MVIGLYDCMSLHTRCPLTGAPIDHFTAGHHLIYITCVYRMWMKIINHNPMARRINVILPEATEATVRTIDRLSRPGQRSRFIDRAVQHYVVTASPDALQERLKQAAIRDHDLDLEIAGDWFAHQTAGRG
jgi:CopG family transcriptional regulator/antitoxin EndoAI